MNEWMNEWINEWINIYYTEIPFADSNTDKSQSQWPRGLRRRSAAARLLRLWVRIPQAAWTSVCYKCCVLWGRGPSDELITRPEESNRLWCVVVCDLETSGMWRPRPASCRSEIKKKHKRRNSSVRELQRMGIIDADTTDIFMAKYLII